ncbi:MAG: hypothetical protein WCY98_05240 [Castellaniella sp.]
MRARRNPERTLALCAGVLCLSSAWALDMRPQPDPSADMDQASVLELMRLETAQALDQALAGRHPQGIGPASAEPVSGAAVASTLPVLLSIHGVGASLRADVIFRSRRFRYHAGQPQASGPQSRAGLPLLVGIDAGCLELAAEHGSERLCLTPSLGASR